MTSARPVTDEPVRGSVPPPWFFSLPGIERVRALAQGLIPRNPIGHLFGLNLGHVGAGTATVRMPASANFLGPPFMEVSPLLYVALWNAAVTTIPAGFDVVPVTVSQQYFRPPRPQPGNLLARARTLNASSVFVCSMVDAEDPVGRQVGHAVAQFAVRAIDPPPPAAPASIDPVDEPTYPTADPPDRPPTGAGIPAELASRHTGLEIGRMLVSGELPPFPLQNLLGIRLLEVKEGEVRVAMPASEWFCRTSRNVSEVGIGVLLDVAGTIAALSLLAKGQSFVGLETSARFLGSVPADGRELIARGRLRYRASNHLFVEVEVFDTDGSVVASQLLSWASLERGDRIPVEPERVLATLLFTDIVGSTQRAQRMGDAAWRSLLGEHHALVRRELAAHRGREVNTIGDGFLARFDSPASALRCARAIRNGVRQMDLEIRSGIHTGECEIHGADLTGIALHVAARIVALAGASEILVSQMVKDLAAGSGLRFAPRGSHALKGVEGEWTLFAVEDA